MSFSFFSDVSSCFARGVYIAKPLGTRSFNDAKKQSRCPQDSCRNDQSRETRCGEGIISENCVNHSPPPVCPPWGTPPSRNYLPCFVGFPPDIHISLDHEIAEGEYVVHHITLTGTQKGEFIGRAATDKKVTWKETTC